MSKRKPPPPPEPDESCAHCAHWREQTETADQVRWGMCHRYPPIPVHNTDEDGADTIDCVDAWTVLPHACGEFRPRLAS